MLAAAVVWQSLVSSLLLLQLYERVIGPDQSAIWQLAAGSTGRLGSHSLPHALLHQRVALVLWSSHRLRPGLCLD